MNHPSHKQLMNPYQEFVESFARLLREGKSCPLGGFAPAARPSGPAAGRKALIFSPHPDDECIIGGLALRLLREARLNVLNVAVTQGSKKERQTERFRELQNACRFLGFGPEATAANGLERINPHTRAADAAHWASCLKIITALLAQHRPQVIFFPHEQDWNSTHIGTHFLVMDALRQLPADFECYLVETEFWGQMTQPNLMVEIGSADLADLVAATSFHVGEVQRNPYHLLLPAWMMDNVRRGSELVGGQGGEAPGFLFATLYRLRKWKQGGVREVLQKGRFLPAAANAGELLV